ncbi:DUF2169 family type VI secretion system accessory protein [Archangium primigenium]|uniref:DUF2169 family type VI secretion system accessory protein n=1 Tax=[Archangium] primigenium TaxID=2792470 RepID=UPI00195DE2A6|nr:DUF2169 domain-containing protein [Archangium primigenium]MBM7116339.1 DUF2169 domain-containing protein [Archangium primigenium]
MIIDNLLAPLQAGLSLATDKHGHEHVLTVVKGTFDVGPDGTCVPAIEQSPAVRADVFHGEPGLSSVRWESDFALRKPLTDVLVLGNAYAPRGEPVESMLVGLKVGSVRKVLHVFGDRVWERTLVRGHRPSRPQPFVKLPLLYERAFGGADLSHPDVRRHVYEAANTVGVGIHARTHDRIRDTPLPNLEDPERLITSPMDRPRPMGLGFISRNWTPRRLYAGTYDQAWRDSRFPFLPLDFDDRYFQGAPEDQTCPYLKGGEQVLLTGGTPDGRWAFTLPRLSVPVTLHYRSGPRDLLGLLDTIMLLPDEKRCVLVWRATARLEGKPTHLREVQVGTTLGRERARQTGKRYIRWGRGAV